MQRCLWLLVWNWEGPKVQLPETLKKGEFSKHIYLLTTSPFNLAHLGIRNVLGWMFWMELSRALPGRTRAAGVKGCVTGKIPAQIKIKKLLSALLKWMKNALVYPPGVCRSSRNLWAPVICQLSQSPALNGWESRAGISDPVPWMLQGGKCWPWEWAGGPSTLLLSGIACSVCGPSWHVPNFLPRCWMSRRKRGNSQGAPLREAWRPVQNRKVSENK